MGFSANDFGILGYAGASFGVYGCAVTNYGLYGRSAGIAVAGNSTGGGYDFCAEGSGCYRGVAYCCSSSIALKKNISTIENALKIIEKLRGVSFFWKNQKWGKKKNYGFVAEEVAEIIPEITSIDQNEDHLSMDGSRIIPYLVESIKELSKQIKQLKKGKNAKSSSVA